MVSDEKEKEKEICVLLRKKETYLCIALRWKKDRNIFRK